jgi:hypothetical protein
MGLVKGEAEIDTMGSGSCGTFGFPFLPGGFGMSDDYVAGTFGWVTIGLFASWDVSFGGDRDDGSSDFTIGLHHVTGDHSGIAISFIGMWTSSNCLWFDGDSYWSTSIYVFSPLIIWREA